MKSTTRGIGPALALLRKASGQRQADVANALGVSTGSVGRLELQTANPQWETLHRVLEVCGATPYDLAVALEAVAAGGKMPSGYRPGPTPTSVDERLVLWLMSELLRLRGEHDELRHDVSTVLMRQGPPPPGAGTV